MIVARCPTVWDASVRIRAQRLTSSSVFVAAELVADLFAAGDHERLGGDRLGAGPNRAATGDQQQSNRLAVSAATWLGEMRARQRFAGSTDGVELV